MTLAASAGTLIASSGGGVTVGGSGTATLTLAGAAAAINAFLDTTSNIQYAGAADANGEDAAAIAVNAGDGVSNPRLGVVNIDIAAVNDAPVLNAGATPALADIVEDAGDDDGADGDDDDDDDGANNADNPGATVAALVADGSIADADGGAVEAIAVTAVDNANGVWQFSTDNGTSWSAFSGATGGAVDMASAARLLDGGLGGASAHRVRFVPDADYSGVATITFRAWDKSAGVAGGVADATSHGDATAFSAATDTASIAVAEVNNAPTLTATAANPVFIEAGNAAVLFTAASASTAEAGQSLTGLAIGAAGPSDGADETLEIDRDDGNGFVAGADGTGAAQQATLGTAFGADGEKTVRVRATDGAGNETVETLTITLDTAAPALTGEGTVSLIDAAVVKDDASLELDDAGSAVGVTLGDKSFLYVAGLLDAGVSGFEIGAGETLTAIENVSDDYILELAGPDFIGSVAVGQKTLLVVPSSGDDGVSVFEIAANGALSNVDNVADDATLLLDGACHLATIEAEGVAYLMVSGARDKGVNLFSVGATGALAHVQSVDDTAALYLDRTYGVASVMAADTPYFAATSPIDDDVSLFELNIPQPVLAAAADTGVSNSDGATNDVTPTVRYIAEAGARVDIDWGDGAGLVAAADGTGAARQATLAAAYPDFGARMIKVRATDAAGNAATEASTMSYDSEAELSGPRRAAASDTGAFATDGITADVTPAILYTAEAGASVASIGTTGPVS